MNKIFIYNDIMRDGPDHSKFDFNTRTKFLGQAEIKGARMFKVHSFPAVVLDNDEYKIVQGELYEYTYEECERRLRFNLFGQEFIEKDVEVSLIHSVDGQTFSAKIYVFQEEPKNGTLITSGEWMFK